jgi:hypothetical protein
MPFAVILVPDLVRDKLRRGIQKILETTGSPGPAFAMAMDGQASRGMTGVVWILPVPGPDLT